MMVNDTKEGAIMLDQGRFPPSVRVKKKRDYVLMVLAVKVAEQAGRGKLLRNKLFGEEGALILQPVLRFISEIDKIRERKKNHWVTMAEDIKEELSKSKVEDPELVRLIQSIRIRSPMLARTINMVENYNAESLYNHFIRYYNWYLTNLDSSVKDSIMVAIRMFLQKHARIRKEAGTIRFFEEEVANWSLPYRDIDGYIVKGNHFVKTLKAFNDPLLVRRLRDPRIQQLLQYQNEVSLFNMIFQQIERGENQGAWQDFEKFYKHVDNISKEVKDVFGDARDANVLRQVRDKYHESPEEWKREIRQILQQLHERKQEVISQARVVFELLFKEDLGNIKISMHHNLLDLQAALYGVAEAHIGQIKRSLKQVFRRAAKLRDSVMDSVNEVRSAYNELEQKPDTKGKNKIERLNLFIASLDELYGEKITKPISHARERINNITRQLPSLRTLGGALPTRDFSTSVLANSRLIGFVAGVGADEEQVMRSGLGLRKNMEAILDDMILNSNFLLSQLEVLIKWLQNAMKGGERDGKK